MKLKKVGKMMIKRIIKFKTVTAKITKMTRWQCPECQAVNVDEGSKIGFKKQCWACLRFFLLRRGRK